jgi:cell division protein FtsX
MFGGNFAGMYINFFIGALGYAITMMLLNWHRHGWAHVKQALLRYLLALPLSLAVSTILFLGCLVFGAMIAAKR